VISIQGVCVSIMGNGILEERERVSMYVCENFKHAGIQRVDLQVQRDQNAVYEAEHRHEHQRVQPRQKDSRDVLEPAVYYGIPG